MSAHFISEKYCKVRKWHTCSICGDPIEVNELCNIFTGVEDGEGFYSLYNHLDCREYTEDWTNDEWESYSTGEVTRQEVRDFFGEEYYNTGE